MWGAWYQHRRIDDGGSPFQGWAVTPAQPDASQPAGSVEFPDFARSARRALDYTLVVTPAQPDALMPSGTRRWVDAAPAARRLADYTFVVNAPASVSTINPISGTPFFPAFASAPRRLPNYTVVVAPGLADAIMPAGVRRFADIAPPARRAAARAYDVALQAPPVFAAATPPASFPVFPDRARGLGRASASAYVGLLSSSPPAPAADLGRFRLGDIILATYQGWSSPVPPQAVIVGPTGPVASPQLSTRDQVNFSASQLLGEGFPLGNYTMTVGGTNVYTFAVVAGGDAEGAIIGIFSTKTVQGKLVVTQTRAGEILLGVNPRFT